MNVEITIKADVNLGKKACDFDTIAVGGDPKDVALALVSAVDVLDSYHHLDGKFIEMIRDLFDIVAGD